MIVWRVSNYNRETDQQPWIKYYRTKAKAMAEYERLIPIRSWHDHEDVINTTLTISRCEVVKSDVLSVLNDWCFGKDEVVKDWDSDPRKAEAEREGGD